jgi:superfamily II DNA/RNA helicase
LAQLSRDELALKYLEQLPFTPYPVQEQALYAWFGSDEGVLVCAPTGTGKTLIAEAAAFEALHTGSTVYYTTPLIALTDQKFHEMQAAAVRWGFQPEDVGLVTGNRRVNPDAKVLVVVAEILLNRLLQDVGHSSNVSADAGSVGHEDSMTFFDFRNVSAVVMDEFHNFSDMERGIVWEFTLSLLPKHVRLLLLSATVGNAVDFLSWLRAGQKRNLELVQSSERKVPLSFQWVADKLLTEQLQEMAQGDADTRRTPALVFCFNREECWSVAEELKGKDVLAEGQQKQLVAKLAKYDWTKGAGPKLKQILMRWVGVHHAGLLPRYRRVVEELFQQKLLSVCVCTETLSAGINLPARSVVMPSLLKGPPGKMRLIDPSTAHQIFGRAGRPQYDSHGYVFALPHEDDVRILRWKEKYDQIPEDTKDPKLLQAKKAMKKKQPTRSPNRQYWDEAQFQKLRAASPRDLVSQGHLPWRMLAYMVQLSPDVNLLRQLVRKRLMDPKRLDQAEKHLHQMLQTLHTAGIVRLEPEPPAATDDGEEASQAGTEQQAAAPVHKPTALERAMTEALQKQHATTGKGPLVVTAEAAPPEYKPERAFPTGRMADFFLFRSVNPVYALFLLEQFALADPIERLQALESVLELPKSLMRSVRVPNPDKLPPGPLATGYLDAELVTRGVIAAGDLYPPWDPDIPFEERKYAPPLAEKLKMLFDATYPYVHGVFVQPVWAAAELVNFEFNFQGYIGSLDLAKQEGLIFRHLLRLILLLGEFSQVTPPGMDQSLWRGELKELADRLTACCREVDPTSTEYMLAHAADQDIVVREPPAGEKSVVSAASPQAERAVDAGTSGSIPPEGEQAEVADPVSPDDFGSGILESE